MSGDPGTPEAWNRLYSSQPRPWRGVAEVPPLPIPPGGRVLDIGCGNGKTSAALLERGYTVVGADFSQEAVSACLRLLGGRMSAVCCRSDSLPFLDASFDGATLVHLMEHLDDRSAERTASEVRRVLRPGGAVFVRSFSPEDMRAGGPPVRGNGIPYRYLGHEEVVSFFAGFEVLRAGTVSERTRFGAVRSRSECLLRRP
ncbi:MAG: class I SAM-dependent methyltransferase [Candidatus Methanomethylophilaceae archaeon]|nr:class I SAM-dependent methyltransferase [Candidatus Methanomethylophilaceae archaeon]NLF34070.1 class I SAM-dependent methyltransferase [Thermoplasmatales archaeon]